ncbi:MAG: DUF6790 family protein [Ignavibacteria bacterium]|jgi:hypothetical protein|nr:stearoyl-CoA 9-desaturase [Ignavibacteria bacterium]
MIYLVSYLCGWILGIIIYFLKPEYGFINTQLLVQLVFTVGFFGIFNFIGHVFLSKQVAQKIGWESNLFQKELGWVSLGIGISGILCYWIRDNFWIATIIPFSTFLIGAGAIHIIEMIRNKNFEPGNTWIILPDFLMPITLIVLLVLR